MARSPAQVDTTLRLKWQFLDTYAQAAVLAWAAKRAGVARSTVYDRRGDPGFESAFQGAAADNLAELEAEAVRRATVGVAKPVFWQGRKVGIITEYSDVLLIFLLKSRDPETYRESKTVDL